MTRRHGPAYWRNGKPLPVDEYMKDRRISGIADRRKEIHAELAAMHRRASDSCNPNCVHSQDSAHVENGLRDAKSAVVTCVYCGKPSQGAVDVYGEYRLDCPMPVCSGCDEWLQDEPLDEMGKP